MDDAGPAGGLGPDDSTLHESSRSEEETLGRGVPGPLWAGMPKGLSDQDPRRYEDGGRIASGGMGEIRYVHDRALGRDLAKKLVLASRRTATDVVARFLDEARVTAQLAHPGVVPVHDLGLDSDGNLFFTMKLVSGRTFAEIVELVHAGDPEWTVSRGLQTFLRIMETLAFAHSRGVIHRDLKPANVMVGEFGEVYVMDWGLAKVLGVPGEHGDARAAGSAARPGSGSDVVLDGGSGVSHGETVVGTVVGTPAYMAPEQAAGDVDQLDARADIYALGAILYALLSGHPPYATAGARSTPLEVVQAVLSGPPRALPDSVPDELRAITEKAMARDRAARYAGADELRSDVQAFLDGRVVRAYRTGAVVEIRKWITRNRALAASVAAGLLVTIGGSIAFALHATDAAETLAAERDKERAARVRADGLRLSARASSEVDSDPALALVLGIEGAARADDTHGNTVLYGALGSLHEIATLAAHEGYVGAVTFDPTGERLLSSSSEFILWDVGARRPVAWLDAHTDRITASAFAPRGGALATGSADGTVRLWRTKDGAGQHVLDAGSPVRGLAWNPAGTRIAALNDAGGLRVWDATDGALELERVLDVRVSGALAYRPDGARLAVQAWDRSVDLLDATTLEPVARLDSDAPTPEEHRHGTIGWLDSGRQLVSWTAGVTDVWSVAQTQRVATFGTEDLPSGAPAWGVADDALVLRVGTPRDERTALVVWDLAGRRERVRITEPPHLTWYAFSTDGRVLVGVGGDPANRGRIWDAHTGELLAELAGHGYSVAGVATSSAGLIATGSADTTVRLWRERPYNVRPAGLRPEHGQPLEFSRSGDVALTRPGSDGDSSGPVVCRAVRDGRELFALPDAVGGGTFDPTGSRLAVVGPRPGHVSVLSGRDGEPIWTERVFADAETPPSVALDLSGDGTRLFATVGGVTEVRATDDGTLLSTFTHPAGRFGRPRWSEDGSGVLLRDGRGRRVLEVETTTGEVVQRYEGKHNGYVVDMRFGPLGRYVATAAADTTVLLWDRASGDVVHRFTGLHMGDIRIEFDPSGRFIVVRSLVGATVLDVENRCVFGTADVPDLGPVSFDADGALLWRTTPEPHFVHLPFDPVAAARATQPRPLTPLEAVTYELGDETVHARVLHAYLAWVQSPGSIAVIGLHAAREGRDERLARCVTRLGEIAGEHPEQQVLEAAQLARAGDASAAIDALVLAVQRGCPPEYLGATVFERLRDTPAWSQVTEATRR